MNGFLVIGFNAIVSDNIIEKNLETELNKRKISFKKNIWNNNIYSNIISYQLFKETEKDYRDYKNLPLVVVGDIYGNLESENDKLLSYNEAIDLIQESKFNEQYVAFEGNSCFGSFTNEKLIFQNDLEGYRKLYYYKNNDIFCISTYLPLILASINKKWTLRKNAVLSFICSRESKWPLTFIEDVFVLPPLSRMEVTIDGLNIESRRYSDFYNIEKVSEDEVREQLRSNYELIVKRKKSENTAVTLSGGYDSNCLTKLFLNVYGNNFTAVSVGYDAKHERGTNINDETIYAQKVADNLGIPFKKYIFSKEDYFNELDSFVNVIDQPGLDPSSNFLMNKYLKSDGFSLVINGMGGDANFSNKKSLYYGITTFELSKYLGLSTISKIGKYLNHRGPLSYFKPIPGFDKVKSFHDLYERTQIFTSPVCSFFNNNVLNEIDSERNLRSSYFEKIYSTANSKQEISYSLSVFCNPDEYHALSMAERNNIEILMPFVNTKAVIEMMNGSHKNNINNRDFEMSIFGGINKKLLAKSKSGFSIPYAEWMGFYSKTVFDYYFDKECFSKDDFDLQSFQFRYNNDESFSKSNFANIVIWKLFILKNYIEENNLNIN